MVAKGNASQNSFLIVTIASGLISALPAIGKNPSSVATILATQLPKASNFFLVSFPGLEWALPSLTGILGRPMSCCKRLALRVTFSRSSRS